jgi:hypothetical protein
MTHDHDVAAALAREQAAVAEGQRLSAEVARLREERDSIDVALGLVEVHRDAVLRERDAARAALYDLASAVRALEERGGAVSPVVRMRRMNAEELLGEKATHPLSPRYDFRARRARAALASLGSPQDERNPNRSNEE